MQKHFAGFVLGVSLVANVLAADKKPNFVVIFTDDLGYQDIGCFGSPKIKTPNIDKMAEEGMKFTSFYAQTVCGPSRAALLTGCYPLRLARNDNGSIPHPKMALSEVTVAEVLKDAGYATGVFGKWDLAGHSQTQFNYDLAPTKQGFDTAFWTPGSNDSIVNILRQDEMIESGANMAQLSRRYTDEAISFIDMNADQPFFVYLAHSMPHTKLAVAPPFKGKSERGLYGDVVEEIDFHVGRLLEKLKEKGLDDNTYVIFTSDNGPWWVKKEDGGSAAPLRGAKCSAYEGGSRVPFVIRAPGKVPAGKVSEQVTATIDILPTFARLAGGEVPTDRVIDGIDVSELWHGEDSELDRTFYYYSHTRLRGVRKGKWKLLVPHIEEDKKIASLKNWPKMVPPADRGWQTEVELYNIEKDISEEHNIANENPEIVVELQKLVEQARKDIGDSAKRGVNARPLGDEPYKTPDNKHAVQIKGKKK
ncbi:sulfatase [Rubritalea spongiae]|uniref:Sulfatase n=1 Tax=Rubritalea spongiae TaxID=430797 RepID=A0ABW5E325_9BACT